MVELHRSGRSINGLAKEFGISNWSIRQWLKQADREVQQLGIPLDLVRTFSPRLQRLVGFGTYKHLIGHIDKASPSQVLLGVDDAFRTVWDVIDVRSPGR